MASLVPGAATPRLRAWLAQTSGSGTVLHAGRDAVYAEVRGRCVGVLTRSAAQVPCGVRTSMASLRARAGDSVRVSDGRLEVADHCVRVARTVPVRKVRFGDPSRAHAALRNGLRQRLGAVLEELGAEPLEALVAGDAAAVLRLLGRGSGLTPLGDDVLCGWLATTGGPSAVGDEVARLAQERTTVLSAALLECARHGETLPEFGRLAASLDVVPEKSGEALDALLRVGHTSGLGLAVGCLLALAPNVDVVW